MSKYNYTSWHDIKDLVSIYHEDEWDNAKIKTWDPENQREYDLVFCGSSRPTDTEPGEINFVVNKINSNEYTNEEKTINEYFESEFSNLIKFMKENERKTYEMFFKRGIELGKQLSKNE